MPQPTPYVREFNFTEFQATSPSAPLPGYRVDAELDGIADTLNGVLGNLVLIQRDDGALANGCVTLDALSDDVLLAIAGAVVGNAKGEDGADAPLPQFSFATNTLAPGAAATVSVSGTYPDLLLTFGIPKGDATVGGATLEDADYGDVVVSGGGSAMTVQAVGGQVPSFPGHTHGIANITGLQAALDGKQAAGAYLVTSDLTWGNLQDKPTSFAPSAHTHSIAGVTGLQAALDAKQAAGTYVTPSQLASKADVLTPVESYSTNQTVSDATHNGCYNRLTGAALLIVTFNATPADGHCSIWVNRGTVGMTIACAGGYYKNGGALATANLTLAPGGKLTAFHEGDGVWTLDGTGF